MNQLFEKIKRCRITLLSGGITLIGVLGFAQPSHADWLPSWNDVTEGLLAAAGGLAGFFGFYIANFLNYVMVKLFTFAGYLIDLGITLNQGIMQDGLVRVGWLITRDIANLGFTVGMIAIAFATIFRMEQYGVKKLLAKLIFVALLINFSLTIPGIILDGTHVFSKFFLSKITGDEAALSRFSESIAAAFNIQNLTQAPLDAALNVNDIGQVFVLISSVLFLALFGTLGVIALGATAYMVFYRYMVLTFLFIVAPLAWISLFLPGFSKHWDEWWNTFFKWAFFLPLMTFFFYLSIYTAQHMGDVRIMDVVNNAHLSASLKDVPSIGRLAGVLGQMVVILGLMVGGLMVSQKMGIAGAAAAIGMAAGVKKFTLGAIKGAAVGAVAGPAAYLGTRPLKAGAMGLASLLNRPALRWIPGAKGAVAGLSAFGQRKEEVSAYQKQNLSSLGDLEFEKVLRGGLPEGPVARAALLAEAVKRKKIGKIANDKEKLKALAAAAKSTNPNVEKIEDVDDVKEILGVQASLAPELTKGRLTTFEAARRFVSSDKAHDQSVEELGKASVIGAFNEGHWKDLTENPKTTFEQLASAQGTVERMVGPELLKLYQDYALAQIEIDRAKQEGLRESDVIIRHKDGTSEVIKGLKTLRKEKFADLNKRRDELFTQTSTVTAKDKEEYKEIISDRRMNDPKFIKSFKDQYGHEPSEEELILIERGRMYKQLEMSRKQVGGLFYRPYNPKGGKGTGAGETELFEAARERERKEKEGVAEEERLAAFGVGSAPQAPAPAPTRAETPAEVRSRVARERQAVEAERGAEADVEHLAALGEATPTKKTPPPPPPPAPPTPPSPPPTGGTPVKPAPKPAPQPPAAGRFERTPKEEAEISAAVEALKEERAREARKTPPQRPEEIKERAERIGGAGTIASAGEERRPPITGSEEARRRAEENRKAAEESARHIREEAEKTTAAEEAGLKAAEKSAVEAAKGAKAAEEELDARVKIAKETGEQLKTTEVIGKTETEIAKEIEKAKQAAEETAEATKKVVQEIAALNLRNREDFTKAFVSDKINELLGAEITTPADNKKRIIKNVVRNNINPMQTTIVTADDERIDLNQLFKYADKADKPVEVRKKKT